MLLYIEIDVDLLYHEPCLQNKDDGKFGCRVIFPHPKKAELDKFVYLPDELLADNEEDAKQYGSLAGLNHIAGVCAAYVV